VPAIASAKAGFPIYNKIDDAYYLSGNSVFLWKSVSSDFELESLITLLPQADSTSFSAGLKVCSSLDPDAPYLACILRSNGQVSLKYRNDPGAATTEILFDITGAEMLQMQKKEDTYTVMAAKFGLEYEAKEVKMPGLNADLRTGFFIEAGSRDSGGITRFCRTRFFQDF
jgi:hypothetical protein